MKYQISNIKYQIAQGVTRVEGFPTARSELLVRVAERALAGGKRAAGPHGELGQSLIEVMIALAASVAVVSAIAVTVITSLSNAEFTKNQNLATQYGGEGMEIVRQIAKNNWTLFVNTYKSVHYCLDKSKNLSLMTGLNCGQNVGIFNRQIDIDQASPSCTNSVKISSIVSWSDSKCTSGNPFCHQVKIDSCLADINTIKAP